jgi:DNA-directed RNA polymerase specialized sigma24 family protein
LRDPLSLTSIEGLPQAEAAEILGLTVKAVEGAVYRAKKQLAETLRVDRPQPAPRRAAQPAEPLFRRIDSITW